MPTITPPKVKLVRPTGQAPSSDKTESENSIIPSPESNPVPNPILKAGELEIEVTNPFIKNLLVPKPKKPRRTNTRHIPYRVANEFDGKEFCQVCGTNNNSPHYCNRIINGLQERGVPENWLVRAARWELAERLATRERLGVDITQLSFNEVKLEAYLTAQKIMKKDK